LPDDADEMYEAQIDEEYFNTAFGSTDELVDEIMGAIYEATKTVWN